MNLLKEFLAEEDGFGVVEMLLIIAALVCVAMIFRKSIMNFVSDTASDVFSNADTEANKTPDLDDPNNPLGYDGGN